ncbi:Mu transposase C-terminal domain-containing protein [Pseudomonas moraviensis]|uniref:Mu transposase C-terminal domain-containing protein n=1 Tax=Pseudomonas moraviensis TaxID=321662 RepID=UPI0009FA19B6|nr:Mu transposase C-terminal domain-containing protein [Pseudomonas moraviensis]
MNSKTQSPVFKKKRSSSSGSSNSNATTTTAAKLNVNSSKHSVTRYEVASERIPTIKLYLAGDLTAKEAAQFIGIKVSGFHKIIRRVRAHGGDLSAVTAGAPGRRNTPLEFGAEMEQLIVDAVSAYRGKAATIEKVWVTANVLADERGLKRPSYHSVRRRLMAKGKRFLTQMRLGKTEAADILEARPGYKVTTRPLEWVQIDHTRVDLMVVDEKDRKVIDRPWVSFAICIHTRAIVGFYLSLLPPNGVTVAMLVENIVLPKSSMLASLGLDEHIWPMYGIPDVIHADNAAEFRSEVLKANLKRFGVKVEHRDVGKKHQGGHIERLIGTMMSSHIHFLRGTTYSNTQQRGDEDCEGRASFTISALRKFFVCAIHAYNNRKHSAIKMFPAEKWKEHFAHHAPPRQIDESYYQNFRYVLFPEKPKLIRSGGIEMHSRFYYAPCLQHKIRDELIVKFDPNDFSNIYIDLNEDGKYVKIPEYRNVAGRSSDYAAYRVERQQRGERDGTYSPEGTASLALGEAIAQEEYRKTAKIKRQAAKEAGKRDQKQYTESLAAQSNYVIPSEVVLVDQMDHLGSESIPTTDKKPAKQRKAQEKSSRQERARLRGIEGARAVTEQRWRGFSKDNFIEQIDFDVPPTIY